MEAEVEEGKITAVSVLSHEDTPSIANKALETMIQRVINSNSLNVDTVTGATRTSKGFLDVLRDAFKN